MAELLSDEWFRRFAEAIASLAPAAGEPPLALGVVVTGTPAGTVSYTILIGDGGASLVVGSTDEAAVTLVEDFSTAQAIAAGTPVSALLEAGRITLRGDAKALIAGVPQLEALVEVLTCPEEGTPTRKIRQGGP
ncbi:MAG: hypothetical protein ABSC73_01645 [Acidimicrobiales bacterium]